MLLTIQVDMKDNTKMNIAMWCGFLVTGFMFAVTTLLAAYRYGKNVQANILQEIVRYTKLILEEDVDVEPQQVFIEPTDSAVLSDEDQGGFINKLTGRQLGARCEVILAGKSKDRVRRLKATTSKTVKSYSKPQLGSSGNQTSRNRGRGLFQRRSGGRRGGRPRGRYSESTIGRITNRTSDHSTDSSSNESDTDSSGEQTSKKPKTRTWIHKDLSIELPLFSEGYYSSFKEKTPLEMVELFLGDAVIKLLVEQSNKYAAFLNCPDPKITHDEKSWTSTQLDIKVLQKSNKAPMQNVGLCAACNYQFHT
ncbi:hypothetical protein EVAR_30708_1 [Eumeta japonica]|uniref:Uncharacterized protein n=1 Tax=Eumeta variegata TaxID=151549 RepID=A0A4C1V786_EUMVA|nr:hypothetical protein EVAR_30708_1 [Eumeta japonica]